MSNLPEPKVIGQNRILLEKHREYLKQISESEACPSRAKIADIARETGLEWKTVYGWFKAQRSIKTFVNSKMGDH